ncbi:type IV secretion system protein VirJ [Sphingomonas gei]|uniref:Type IV secretion system protein VirJ n=1 Tax=Sphingomonas gei TaxID=1395960 RepID=A0A4V3QZI2_9SPHN|nr:AcvB/VirJ family lysyl-phosphatidylglycerol hydrolase [Sphingomonas gei]TGX54332.1 type IV secretion system protein VirJ [Sphingomonas gei]
MFSRARPRTPQRWIPTWLGWAGILVAILALIVAGLYASAGFFDRDPVHLFGMGGARRPVAAVYFSGDMGLRFGMGPYVADALAEAGVPVLGVASSTAFASHRTRAETDAIVVGAIRQTLQRTGADRVVVLGQSFGADIARVGLADLPQALRAKVAAAVLVVPGRTAYFRADPSGLSYRGTPDADASEAPLLRWLPLVCIRGAAETDTLCPALVAPNVRRIALPGGHFLRNDHALLVRTILDALGPFLKSPEKS